jgi:hypothetical protein
VASLAHSSAGRRERGNQRLDRGQPNPVRPIGGITALPLTICSDPSLAPFPLSCGGLNFPAICLKYNL